MPNPGFLVKKIPTWKMTVKAWDNEEFKNQMAMLFDELNEVSCIASLAYFLAIRMGPGEVRLRGRAGLPGLQEER